MEGGGGRRGGRGEEGGEGRGGRGKEGGVRAAGRGEERVNMRHAVEMSCGSRDHSVSTKRKDFLIYFYIIC